MVLNNYEFDKDLYLYAELYLYLQKATLLIFFLNLPIISDALTLYYSILSY